MKHAPLTPAERAARLEHAHTELVEALEQLRSGEQWIAYLGLQARVHHYSAANTIRIWSARPDASLVMGFRAWIQIGRHVRRGEHGIKIIAPIARRMEQDKPDPGTSSHERAESEEGEQARVVSGFRVATVFDIAQTDGDPVAVAPRPVLLPGEAPPQMWKELAEQVRAAGYGIELVEEIDSSGETNGATNFTTHVVQIATARRDPASRARTLAHELTHALVHHDGTTPRPTAEVEAESVAFLVADAYGLDASAYTIPYLAAWSAVADPDAMLATAQRVQTTAAAILAARPEADESSAAAEVA